MTTTCLGLPGLAALVAAGIDTAGFPPAEAPLRAMLALCEEAGELAEAYTSFRAAVVAYAPAGELAARWDAVEAETADVAITAYVAAHVLGVPLPAAVDGLYDSPPTLTEEGHLLAVCQAATGTAAAWRRYAGLARRRGNWQEVAAGLAEVSRWLRRTAVVLDVDLAAACARKAEVILTRGWREPVLAEAVTA